MGDIFRAYHHKYDLPVLRTRVFLGTIRRRSWRIFVVHRSNRARILFFTSIAKGELEIKELEQKSSTV